MANILLNKPYVTVGLGTTTCEAIPAAGLYRVSVQNTENPPSSLVITVNKNGAPVYTSALPGAVQIAQQFQISLLLAATDVITVVLSSAAAVDNLLNSVKTNIAVMQGA